jgi:hypothetical protein
LVFHICFSDFRRSSSDRTEKEATTPKRSLMLAAKQSPEFIQDSRGGLALIVRQPCRSRRWSAGSASSQCSDSLTHGVHFCIYPSRVQQQVLKRWIGAQRYIYNRKVEELDYQLWLKNNAKFSNRFQESDEKYCPWDQTFSKYNESAPWLEEIPSYVRRNGCSRFKASIGKWGKGSGRPQHKTRRSSQSVLLTAECFTLRTCDERRMFVCRDENQQHWRFKVDSSLPVQRTKTDLYYAPTRREMVRRFLVRVARNSAVNQGPRKQRGSAWTGSRRGQPCH